MSTLASVTSWGRIHRKSSLTRREKIDGWLFVSPWILGFVLFTAGPMLASLVISFTAWDLIGAPRWIGLDNWSRLASDPLVRQSLRVTTIYALVSVPLSIVLGFGLALLLNTGIRGLSLYRTVFYLPAVLSGVAVALLWQWVFQPEFGLLNLALAKVGIAGPLWLGSADWALPSLILMSLWDVGGSMVIYLAGLQGIPRDLYDSARVDGAGWRGQLRDVTVPLMTPVIFFQLVIGVIRSLQVFTEAYIMTGGGPADATLFFMLYLYRNAFEYYQMGYASALAWVLFLYILVLTLVILWTSKRWVYYEEGGTAG